MVAQDRMVAEWRVSDMGGGGPAAVAGACKPIVMRDLCRHWPVVEAAQRSADDALVHVARLAGEERAEMFTAPADVRGRYHYGDGLAGFNFSRTNVTVRDALSQIAANGSGGRQSAYLGSLPAETYFPNFAQENICPWPSTGGGARLWIGNASTIACHYDMYDNLACVAAGRRRFTLYPPDAIGDLYVGPIDRTLAGQPISLAEGAGDDGRFPRFRAAADRALTAELAPGDALYLPKLWWHPVEALHPVNILVNYWWDGFSAGPDAPHTAMLLAMIAIAERPEAERAAWRSYFDHYVFRPDGHPLAHLPPEQHGVLGPLALGNYGRIRALVMRLLRGG